MKKDMLEIPGNWLGTKRILSIIEEAGQLPYMIFYQSKGGWPGFQLFETLEEAEKCVDRMKVSGLKPVLYLDLTDVEIVEGE